MRTTVLERPRLWSESGTWRFVRADLTLRFEPVGRPPCDVHYGFRIIALGPLGLGATPPRCRPSAPTYDARPVSSLAGDGLHTIRLSG